VSTSVFRPGDRPLLNLALLGLTALTTFGVFHWELGGGVRGSVTFSLCLLLILGSHEMGHYLLARYHRVETSLPYFLPFPLGVGTLGAVIRIRAKIPNKNALVDIGGAGPIAGLLVALPILIYGLLHSPATDTVPPTHWPSSTSMWAVAGHVVDFLVARWHGHTLPASPETTGPILFGDNLLTLGLKRLLLGPFPPGKDIHEHPAYLAGWFGLLVTMLNLIPIGQLDGGHLTHALFGERARGIGRAMGGFMLGLCLFASAGWIAWILVTTTVVGFKHPEVLDPQMPLTPARKWLCLACGVALVLCLMPLPIQVLEG
jgi:membrane-associated protease RseP (regulator of RpoE activity)